MRTKPGTSSVYEFSLISIFDYLKKKKGFSVDGIKNKVYFKRSVSYNRPHLSCDILA